MTHDTTPPKRIWVRWPQPSGTGLAFSCQSRPPELRTEYILASEVDALVAAALEPVMNLLMEPVATHTDSDWLGLRHDLLVQVTSAPAAAALDKLIREAEARGMEQIASELHQMAMMVPDYESSKILENRASALRTIAAPTRAAEEHDIR